MAGRSELPVEEGYVYGQAPQQPNPPPDIQGMFDAIGVPKGKLGELPYPVDWYAGAKDRAAARVLEMEQLYAEKDSLRQQWCRLVVTDLESWHARVDTKLGERGAVAGLAELLARAAHERPGDQARIRQLEERTDEAFASMAYVTGALTDAKERVIINEENVRMKEEEDRASEVRRMEEQRRLADRKRRAEKVLARQAAALRGEELPDDSEDEELGSRGGAAHDSKTDLKAPEAAKEEEFTPRTVAAAVGGAAIVTVALSPAKVPAKTFLAAPSPSSAYPAPELRGGLGRQLPPLETSPLRSQRRPSSSTGSRDAGH